LTDYSLQSLISWTSQPEGAESTQPRKVIMDGKEGTSRLSCCQYPVHLL